MGAQQPATKKCCSPTLVDPEGRMPGQLPSAEALPKDYTQRKSDAVSLVKSMLGREVVVKHKNKSMKWLVVEPFDLEDHNNNFAPEHNARDAIRDEVYGPARKCLHPPC